MIFHGQTGLVMDSQTKSCCRGRSNCRLLCQGLPGYQRCRSVDPPSPPRPDVKPVLVHCCLLRVRTPSHGMMVLGYHACWRAGYPGHWCLITEQSGPGFPERPSIVTTPTSGDVPLQPHGLTLNILAGGTPPRQVPHFAPDYAGLYLRIQLGIRILGIEGGDGAWPPHLYL